MPWLDRPAGAYVRQELVLHRVDDPLLVNVTDPVSSNTALYDIWEVRIVYVFDAQSAVWSVGTLSSFGYRHSIRAGNLGPRVEVRATSPELRDLAQRHCPNWIPDPSKPRLELPAADVWQEATDVAAAAVASHSTITRGIADTVRRIIAGISNPYA